MCFFLSCPDGPLGQDRMQAGLLDAYQTLAAQYPNGVEVIGDWELLTPDYIKQFTVRVVHVPTESVMASVDALTIRNLLKQEGNRVLIF